MARPRSRLVDFSVYVLVRVVVAVLQALSFQAARRFAHGLALLIYHVNGRHRRVADENLRHAYPNLDAAARDRMVRAVYRHFCSLLIEILFLPRILHVTNWKFHFRLKGNQRFFEALLGDRPLLIVTGHFGNWELSGCAMSQLGFPLHAIARPLDNPYLDAFLRSYRERTGQKLLAKKGDFDRIRQVLAASGILATVADQDAGPRGLFVEFFGRPASTHKAVALMAIEHDVMLMVGGAVRVGDPLVYESPVEDLIDPRDYRDRPDAVRALTQRFTSALERMIRRDPSQYFWLHRRWKHTPPVRKASQAA